MGFDAIQEKKEKEVLKLSKKEKKMLKELGNVSSVYPVVGYTEDLFVELRIGAKYTGYMEVLDPAKFDLVMLTDPEFIDCFKAYHKYLNEYGAPIKEVYLNMSENNRVQQDYILRKKEKATNPIQIRDLDEELLKLKYLEETKTIKTVVVMCFADTVESLKTRVDELKKYKKLSFQPMSIGQKRDLFRRMNNKGGY
ncbi:hypothetical protein RAK27_18695 [Carnobacterium maltaromaticum]|uniref:Uncharacterized protein n=1 Tax=Carnobacterium maltaromaticum TaxID=2751 RepID=A0AAW9JZD0_CARML|nr:hypothetical protein [Carnobacterium maltaromaticum]MDZ5760674.1 hypothetical protein [Carnobacterium maltaromaticum]